MDQVELLKMYAVRLAQRLGDNQKCLEFTASRDTGHGIETMTAEVSEYGKIVRVIYSYEGCHANQKLPKRKYAGVSVLVEECCSFDFTRGVAYTYFPDIEKLLEQL
ncbi:hypothetical protein [Streptococcus oralis]|uniref:Uncharacterized protein n=1 Tax=Streptococcus oralis SK610 TaxID=1095741 RepID=I0Q158_STROR|nr:hypothetical protein [Streptococcus oralis]EIC75010.1 hypothetical protein HMPREF1115_0748 [Streptococcus oralis SK610]